MFQFGGTSQKHQVRFQIEGFLFTLRDKRVIVIEY